MEGGITAIVTLIIEGEMSIYRDHGVTFGLLTHLESIGLIVFRSTGGEFVKEWVKSVELNYFGERFLCEMPEGSEGGVGIPLGKVALTQVGRELAPIAGAEALPAHRDYMLNR